VLLLQHGIRLLGIDADSAKHAGTETLLLRT